MFIKIDLDVVKVPFDAEFIKTYKSLTIKLNSSALPSDSYEDIFIKCDTKETKCDNLTNEFNCTCDNLVGGTEYQIKFITKKQNWDEAIFSNIANQFTGNLGSFYFKNF